MKRNFTVLLAIILCGSCLVLQGCASNSCKTCGGEATYSTGFGEYCKDCFEEEFHRKCSRCGKEVSAYVSKGNKSYCHSCATIEFGRVFY